MSPAAVCCGFIFVSLYNVYLLNNYTHFPVRTNIVIDDKLMAEALKATGLRTKKEAVEEGLKLLVKRNKQQAIRKLRGKLHWEGDLEELRGGK
ncbi:type II toxin-antitoxin system VapB family antitoxin [Nitrosococcus oceani]|uniref:type II toxin-antitoxin system VapB family antitoxin n=1 Tax=Nitrosococcus oceani TaxID=1229 RepID=UPI001E4E547D|nr:type II toxin-antitoxin system VapB family antitoxin [Nitrosococcus oceani]